MKFVVAVLEETKRKEIFFLIHFQLLLSGWCRCVSVHGNFHWVKCDIFEIILIDDLNNSNVLTTTTAYFCINNNTSMNRPTRIEVCMYRRWEHRFQSQSISIHPMFIRNHTTDSIKQSLRRQLRFQKPQTHRPPTPQTIMHIEHFLNARFNWLHFRESKENNNKRAGGRSKNKAREAKDEEKKKHFYYLFCKSITWIFIVFAISLQQLKRRKEEDATRNNMRDKEYFPRNWSMSANRSGKTWELNLKQNRKNGIK